MYTRQMLMEVTGGSQDQQGMSSLKISTHPAYDMVW